MSDPSTPAEKLVNSVVFTLVARGAMIIGTGIGLPIALWLSSRAVDSFDRINSKVDTIKDQSIETNGTVKLIQQTQSEQTRLIVDHETRMRVLENLNRTLRPMPP